MNSWRRSVLALAIALFLPYCHVYGIDNFHFYRAGLFVGEPRLERPYLTSADVMFFGGSSTTGRNGLGQKVCLLDIYGPYNMHDLGQGVPNKDLSNPIDIALTELALLPARPGFAQLSFQGEFSTKEIVFNIYQNIRRGFFTQLYLPFRNLSISDIRYTDCSPRDAICPNINTPEWQTFLSLFPSILTKYNLNAGPISTTGPGDLSIYIGWANNYQETKVLDYVDTSIKIGLLIPTGKVANTNNIFELPTGYNGHVGIPAQFDASFGSYDWLTVGCHVGILYFFNKNQTLRMKTNTNQSGFIKLAQGVASVRKGFLFHTGFYFKADHVYRGLSFLAGYTYARENSDFVSPCDTSVFNTCVVNSDQMFKDWSTQTIHLGLDYDFATTDAHVAPHVEIFYDRHIGGRRTFNTSIAGGTIGINVIWRFN